jgi:putative hydrolase of the HAD superfamily
MIDAVLFDFDDTLVPQAPSLSGAFSAVGAEAERRFGLDAAQVVSALHAVAEDGSGSGRVIDDALARLGASVPVEPLIEAFLAWRPLRLDPYPEVPAVLARLGSIVPLGLVTDGDVDLQEAKIAASGLRDHFGAVVCSDRLGRAKRKPSPAPFLLALGVLGVRAPCAAFVGDHPTKDIGGAHALGMTTIRVRRGEHRSAPNVVPADADVVDLAEAEAWLAPRLARREPA